MRDAYGIMKKALQKGESYSDSKGIVWNLKMNYKKSNMEE